MSKTAAGTVAELTPMMRQYLDIKKKTPETFLFFRMGDFYEMFFEDARKASRILGITLTHRGTHKGKPIPMCGVPYHSVDGYLAKMIEANQKVSICEQMEDPRQAKGIVRREVVRTITPGTLIDDSLLSSSQSNYLAAVAIAGAKIGFSYVELTTGEFKVTELRHMGDLEQECARLEVREILIPKNCNDSLQSRDYFSGIWSRCISQPDWIFEYRQAYQTLLEHFGTHSLDGYGLSESIPGINAAGAIVQYVQDNCKSALPQLARLQFYQLGHFMSLDPATQVNLELFQSSRNVETRTLVDILDETQTAMGARMHQSWLRAPLTDSAHIEARQDAVAILREKHEGRRSLRQSLKATGDMERVVGRIRVGNATPRDILALGRALETWPDIKSSLMELEPHLLTDIRRGLGDFKAIQELIRKSIHPETPLTLKDGGVIQTGYHAELDELRSLSHNARELIAAIQKTESQKTGIRNLKVKFNQVFGYYLEVSKGQVSQVPDYFIRKQTLVNAERYITPELKELESKVLGAEQRSVTLEQKLFQEVRETISRDANGLDDAAKQLATLDTLTSFAEAADQHDYVRPLMQEGRDLDIQGGRHPVVEALLGPGEFISNDTFMNCEESQISLITGPNMAGKSTYLRQVALIVLMAQAGCPVPAQSARIGVVDRIFTRVGASDDLSTGKSTFMVEMNETAGILNSASNRSLIVLDEIGRGTSTFDGISIAWAVVEYLSFQTEVKARTLFATHYHELTSLESRLPGVKNFNIAVKEWNEDILFLRKILPGPADKSYGIHVARLAGLPLDVINRAKEVLMKLEAGGLHALSQEEKTDDSPPREFQLDLFQKDSNKYESHRQLVTRLQEVDALNLTPLEAIQVLHQLVGEARQMNGDL